MNEPVIILHGGAGNILPHLLQGAARMEAEKVLSQAIDLGYTLLQSGASAVDAVEKVVCALEEHPLFNAGYGCVLNAAGMPELDASIMDGRNLRNGAVAGISRFRHPITVARRVMEQSQHNLLTGAGAEAFAIEAGCLPVEPESLIFPARRAQLKAVQEADRSGLPFFVDEFDSYKYGTVGAVALDSSGNLAAATSTGGMMNKKYGRVGDSPIIGAGTYANNATCAVSCTGQGESFMQNVVAYDLHALILYGQMQHTEAAKDIIHVKLKAQGAEGGMISIDKYGNVVMEFNTPGMFRAFRKKTHAMWVCSMPYHE